jgi:hypothetical protein
MTLNQYEAYFRDEIASKNLIGHTDARPRFVMLDDDELAKIQSKLDINNFCLILHKYESDLQSNNSGHITDKKIAGFSIVKSLGKGFSSVDVSDVQTQSEVIMQKIYAKMLKDRQNMHPVTLQFDISTFKYQFIKGVFGNCAGTTCEFSLNPSIKPLCGIYNAADWDNP